MKNLIKKLVPVMLALTFCVGAISLAACGNKEVQFTGYKENFMSINVDFTLTLKKDDTAALDVKFEGELNDTMKQIQAGMCKTGTYKYEDNKYVVTLGEGESAQTLTSTYDEATKTYTIPYTVVGRDGSFEVALTYKA